MELKRPHPQIYLFLGSSPADLGRPFVRMVEFYESRSRRLRGRYFTLAAFQRWYCQTRSTSGKFTYYRDYYGYNVPGHVARAWLTVFRDDRRGRSLSPDEEILARVVDAAPPRFYLIGAPARDARTIDHEFSHAFYYLFPEYRDAALMMSRSHDVEGVRRYLKTMCYAPAVLDDEVISYVMCDWPILNRAGVTTKHLWPLRNSLRSLFEAYKTKYLKREFWGVA